MSRPQLWDCFLFGTELDMLEAHLTETDPFVHRWVLVESQRTHRGEPKPLYYAENRERFAPWADRIAHVVTDLPDHPNPWVREHAQRDAALTALADAGDGDVVLISDVDEFPPPRFLRPGPGARVRQHLEPDAAVAFLQRVCLFAVDWEWPADEICSVAARVGYVRARRGLAAVRDARNRYPVIAGGWHLTWLGGPAATAAKLATHCHLEITPQQAQMVASGHCYREGTYYNGTALLPVDVDESWPALIRERKCPPEWFRPR